MQNYFENRNGSIYCLKDCEIIIGKKNITELPNGNLECILFGSLALIHDPKAATKYYTITASTRVELSIHSQDQYFIDENDHYIISFNEQDKFIEHETVPANIKNVSDIFDILLAGNVSNLIPYYEYYDIVIKAMEHNEMLGFPKVLLEFMIAELFLGKDGKSARFSDGEKGIPTSISKLIMNKNTFNALTFEDWSKAIFLNKKKPFKEQEREPSVLEKYMRK